MTLNPIVLNNKTVMLTILFKAASQTLLTFGEKTLAENWDLLLPAHLGPEAQRPLPSALPGCRWRGLDRRFTLDAMQRQLFV